MHVSSLSVYTWDAMKNRAGAGAQTSCSKMADQLRERAFERKVPPDPDGQDGLAWRPGIVRAELFCLFIRMGLSFGQHGQAGPKFRKSITMSI